MQALTFPISFVAQAGHPESEFLYAGQGLGSYEKVTQLRRVGQGHGSWQKEVLRLGRSFSC